MTEIKAPRAAHTSTTTGTGAYSLSSSAKSGCQQFRTCMGDGDTALFVAAGGSKAEIFKGTLHYGSPDTLTRTTVYMTIDGDVVDTSSPSAIDWPSGSRDIHLDLRPEQVLTLALADVGSTGLAAVLSTGVVALRSVTTITGNGLAVTNGDGVSGNIAIALADDAAAVENLTGTGGAERTADNTWALFTLTTAGKALLDDADAGTQRTTLGVGTGDSPQFSAVNVGHASDTTITRSASGRIAVEGSDVALLGTEDQTLAGGAIVTSKSLGTISSGTVTPDPGDRPLQHYTNGGAHTLAPSSNTGSILVDVTNNGSAGAVTTSGFTKVTGDPFDTTNGHKFRCAISIGDAGSLLTVQAMQ